MCTYGKVIGGGHPIGVLSGKAMYLDALDGGAWQYRRRLRPRGRRNPSFAGTFVRHPLALAAARAVLLHLKQAGPSLQAGTEREDGRAGRSRLDTYFVAARHPQAASIISASWFYFTFPGDVRLRRTALLCDARASGIHIQEGYPCFLTTASHPDADNRRHRRPPSARPSTKCRLPAYFPAPASAVAGHARAGPIRQTPRARPPYRAAARDLACGRVERRGQLRLQRVPDLAPARQPCASTTYCSSPWRPSCSVTTRSGARSARMASGCIIAATRQPVINRGTRPGPAWIRDVARSGAGGRG